MKINEINREIQAKEKLSCLRQTFDFQFLTKADDTVLSFPRLIPYGPENEISPNKSYISVTFDNSCLYKQSSRRNVYCFGTAYSTFFLPPPTRTFEKHSFFLTDPMKRKFPSKQTRTSRQVNKRPTTIVYKDNINNRERKESGKKMRSLFRDLRTVYLFTSLFLSSIWFAYFANDLPHDLAPYPLWKIKMLVHTKSFNLYDIYDCRWNTVRTKIEFCKGIFFLCFFHFT